MTLPTFTMGTPRPLFQTRLLEVPSTMRRYAAFDKGQRFMMNMPPDLASNRLIAAVTNWQRLADRAQP